MNRIKTLMIYFILILGVFLCLYPLIFMVIASTHASGDIVSFPPKMNIGSFFFENWKNLQNRINIQTSFWNSLRIALTSTVLNVFVCSIAGYAFAKFEFKYKNFLFSLILLTIMLPAYTRLIPLYRMMNSIGFTNTHLAVILPDIAATFGIFLMRQNFYAIPTSIIESARIDGAGEWHIFFKIVLPLMIPSLSALGIYTFMSQWSSFVWPLIILHSENMYTLPVALSTIRGDTRIDYGQLMVGASYSVVPILVVFFVLQRYFIAGMMQGAVKE